MFAQSRNSKEVSVAAAEGGRKEESAREKGSREERGGISVCGWGHGLDTYTGFMLCLPHGRF